tara:strand:- start:4527 stop:5207 length:681 start_codon:yes stop_codon:yes gene_type:complete
MQNSPLLILCAGFGSRMLNLTLDTPKPLLEVQGKILLGNTINFFRDIGFNEIFINTHYLHTNIESYINKNFNTIQINLIYEPIILGTAGGIKNVFKYTKNNKICVVNSDIFWKALNKFEIINFLKDFNSVKDCKILLSKKKDIYGIKKTSGDFNYKNGNVYKWTQGSEIIFYSGFQIISKNVFKNFNNVFNMNEVWNELIFQKKLKGELINSKILHIGDKNSFDSL